MVTLKRQVVSVIEGSSASPDIQRAQQQITASREEIEKGEKELVRMRGETLKFRREAERLPVRVKIPKRELLAGGLKERKERKKRKKNAIIRKKKI